MKEHYKVSKKVLKPLKVNIGAEQMKMMRRHMRVSLSLFPAKTGKDSLQALHPQISLSKTALQVILNENYIQLILTLNSIIIGHLALFLAQEKKKQTKLFPEGLTHKHVMCSL